MPIFYVECKKHHHTIQIQRPAGYIRGTVYKVWDVHSYPPHEFDFAIKDIKIDPYDRFLFGMVGAFLGEILAFALFGNPLLTFMGLVVGAFSVLAVNERSAVKAREEKWRYE